MKRSELKKVLKPLIKECIKEVIFEEGVLSGLISEVVQGLAGQQMLTETTHVLSQQNPPAAQYQQEEVDPHLHEELEERKRKLEESMGSQFSGILDNTQPLSKGGSLNESPSQSPLSAYAPNDPGVDISDLVQMAGGQNWKHMI